MPDLSQILISLISTIIFIPVNALILWAVTKLFKLANSRFLTALKTAAAAGLVLFIAQQIIGVFSESLITPTADVGALVVSAGLIFAVTIAIAIVVNSYAVKLVYKERTGKAFLVGAVWSVTVWIIGLVIGAILVGIAAAIYLGTSGLA